MSSDARLPRIIPAALGVDAETAKKMEKDTPLASRNRSASENG